MTSVANQCRVSPRTFTAKSHRPAAGFTLIEMLVVLAIVAILSAVAYASYNESVWKTHRREGATCAVEAAQFMERFYTTNLRYNTDLAGVAAVLPALPCAAQANYAYTLVNLAPTTYTINATPNALQTLRDKGRCSVLSINQANVKTETGTETAAFCWD